MCFDLFSDKYPRLAEQLHAMREGGDATDAQSTAALKAELKSVLKNDEPLRPVAEALFPPCPKPSDAFLKFSVSAYHCLGASDEVRAFMGRLWRDTFQYWSGKQREAFLGQIVRQGEMYLFESLDFLLEALKEIRPNPTFMQRWIRQARDAVGNSLSQRGLLKCIENYCTSWPDEARQTILLWFEGHPDDQALSVIARMVAWIRAELTRRGVDSSGPMEVLEEQLRAPGSSQLRALYVESWAFTAGSPLLDEKQALAIRKEVDISEGESLSAWVFLLAQVIGAGQESWEWAFRELEKIAHPSLKVLPKYWVANATLVGWLAATSVTSVTRQRWEELHLKVHPLSEEDGGSWHQIEQTLVDAFESASPDAFALIERLAAVSGNPWLRLFQKKHDAFGYLCSHLNQSGEHSGVTSALCFSPSRSARRLGLILFERCKVPALSSERVAAAEAREIELLLMEASLLLHEPNVLARLHASLADRSVAIGGELAEAFYDQVAIEALNTAGYRAKLMSLVRRNEEVERHINAVNDRIAATGKAASSPALQMEVPGLARARFLAGKRFARSVESGAKEYSILTQIVTTVHLLYGKSWRALDVDGKLGEPSALQESSVRMELPRLSFMIPEAMQIRRIAAGVRIEELDPAGDMVE